MATFNLNLGLPGVKDDEAKNSKLQSLQSLPTFQQTPEQLHLRQNQELSAAAASVTVANSSNIQQQAQNNDGQLNIALAKIAKTISFRDKILQDVVDKLDGLMQTSDRWVDNEPLRGMDEWNRVPNLQGELPYFEGIENQKQALFWINKLSQMKIEQQWSTTFTVEVATFYMIGNALVWAEKLDEERWHIFYEAFLANYVFKDQTKFIDVYMIGRFLGFRDANVVEMLDRHVVSDLEGKYVGHNFFQNYLDQEQAEEKTRRETAQLKKSNQAPNERISMYILIRTPVNTLRQINQKKLMDVVSVLQKNVEQPSESYFYVPDPEKVSRGPFSTRKRTEEPLLIDEICESGKRKTWTESWMHIFLDDRITSKKPGLLNIKTIYVNHQSMVGIVDLGAEYCTIQYSAAVAKGLDMVSKAKTIGLYNDDGRKPALSLGYVDGKVCMMPLALFGKANLWVVPDDSQPTEVIIGESILRNPIVFRDAPVDEEEVPSWLDLEDVVFEETTQLREKDTYN